MTDLLKTDYSPAMIAQGPEGDMGEKESKPHLEIDIEQVRALMRPVITICFLGLAVYLTMKEKISAEMILGTLSTIIGFYFGERSALKKG